MIHWDQPATIPQTVPAVCGDHNDHDKEQNSMTEDRTPQEVAAVIADIGKRAKTSFIDREDAIDALVSCIACGEHVIILGPPGTAKSAMVRWFAAAMDLNFFRRVLNPDTLRDDLIGPTDPVALASGRWERAWCGMATADFALLDEVGKASEQVLNMLLDAMEERRVTSGDMDREIPLHMAVGASNETIQDVEAIWDRFTVRLFVTNVDNTSDFLTMLTADVDMPADDPITRPELVALRYTTKQMAENPSQKVLAKLAEMWRDFSTVSEGRISDRRWRRILRVAAGHALIRGRIDIIPGDLRVARWMLWDDINEHDEVRHWVDEQISEELADIMDTSALLEELEDKLDNINGAGDLTEKGAIYYQAKRLNRDIANLQGDVWDDMRIRLQKISDRASK